MPPPLSSGRARERERNRAEGAVEAGVMLKRLEAKTAPSGALPVVGGTQLAMTELAGRAIPRTPLKSVESGSSSTVYAAAGKFKQGLVVSSPVTATG